MERKQNIQKVVKGLSVAALATGIGLGATGCQTGSGSCGNGSCGKKHSEEGKSSCGKGSCSGGSHSK